MREYYFEEMRPNIKVVVDQKKKKKWVAITTPISSEGETEEQALKSLAYELETLRDGILELLEK